MVTTGTEAWFSSKVTQAFKSRSDASPAHGFETERLKRKLTCFAGTLLTKDCPHMLRNGTAVIFSFIIC